MTNQIIVTTPPRSGTHLIVDAIVEGTSRKSLELTSVTDDIYDMKLFKDPDSVIGIHAWKNDQRFIEFCEGKKVITVERHPIGMALSMLTSYKRGGGRTWTNPIDYPLGKFINSDPNSQEFIDFVISDHFKEYRKITDDWKNQGLCLSFEKLASNDQSEFKRISDYIGQTITKPNLESTRNKYKPYIVFKGDPYFWKDVVSQSTADQIKDHYQDYDMSTKCIDDFNGNMLYNRSINQYLGDR